MTTRRAGEKHPPQAGVADAGSWAAAAEVSAAYDQQQQELIDEALMCARAAEESACRLHELGEGRADLDAILQRWGGQDPAQLKGRVFEWHHTTTFNMDAAAQGAPVRAEMTEWPSGPSVQADPHAAADIRLVDDGEVVAEAQAKVLESTARRVVELAHEKYEGMQLLVPSDHKTSASELIGKRIEQADPDFLHRDAYQSEDARLADHLEHDGLTSTAVDSDEARMMGSDPLGHYGKLDARETQNLADHGAGQQSATEDATNAFVTGALATAATAGGAAAGVTAVISGVKSAAKVHSGELSPTAAAVLCASEAGAAMARGMIVGAGGQALTVAAREGLLAESLGAGSLPFALTRASYQIGHVGLRYARGEITSGEAAAQSAESMSRIAIIWACSAVGQLAIPVPVLGAMVGGTVGTVCATAAVQGLAAVAEELRGARNEEQKLAALRQEIAASLVVMDAELQLLTSLSQRYDTAFSQIVLPAVTDLGVAVQNGNLEQTLAATADVITFYLGTPLFTTRAEFDAWMTSSEPLRL